MRLAFALCVLALLETTAKAQLQPSDFDVMARLRKPPGIA